jgi:tetratricopeptide (TPR) repeat protein
MEFLGRLFGKKQQQEIVVPDAATAVDDIERVYRICKTEIFRACAVQLEPDVGSDRAKSIAGLASNIATGESHRADLLAQMSDSDKSLASRIADAARSDDSLVPIIADAAWWRPQGEVLTAWSAGGEVPADVVDCALELLSTAVHLGGEQPKYLATIAWTYLTAGRLSEAYEAAGVAIASDSTNPEAWRLKGNSAFMLGMLTEAEYCYSSALHLSPGNPVLEESLRLVRSERA